MKVKGLLCRPLLFEESRVNKVKYACYSGSLCMAVAANLPPILFLTFRTAYGLSFAELGLLILLNFSTQLLVDLWLSFFSYRLKLDFWIRFMPWLSAMGLGVYALVPCLFPDCAFLGLAAGTVLFSTSAGLGEVLISPVIAALPWEEPEREMSKLHSVYAWGTIPVVLIATGWLLVFGGEAWPLLVLLFIIVPVGSAMLFRSASLPAMEKPKKISGGLLFLKNKTFLLCILLIFLGGASECTMSQWASGYLETAIGLPKLWGDVAGVCLFALMMGLGRSLYAKRGKNVRGVLFFGAAGALICYLISALTPFDWMGLFACVFTGFCVSMLWPGSLVFSAELFPAGGVFMYAMLAAGGDLGASLSPQLVGVVADLSMEWDWVASLCDRLQLTAESAGMRLGMLVGTAFPLSLLILMLFLRRIKTDAE